MNKEMIQERIRLLNNEVFVTKDALSKLEGHLNEARHWLVEIAKKEAEELKANDKEKSNGEVNEQRACEAVEESICPASSEEVSDS